MYGVAPKVLLGLHANILQCYIMQFKAFFGDHNLLLAVLQLWFVLTVPEDFKLFNWIYSSWNLQNIWLWVFRQHSLNYRCRLVPKYPFHMEEIVLQTCERYTPAEIFDLFYRSCIEAVHHCIYAGSS